MNVKHEQLNNFFIALTLSVCLFTVVDIAYDERIWEFSTFTLKARIWALCITVASFYLVNYIFRRIARFFTDKNKDKKSGKRKEYTLVFLVNFILLNAIHLFIMVYITQMYSGAFFRWRESVLINVTGSVLLLLYYTMIRNHILSKTLIQQNIQLEKVKVDQLETELKFLKSRYHPHFLFNALNTIYFQVDERNREARQSIEQLSHLLRYQLYDIEQEVTMEQEINYLKSYVAFQRQRTSERLVLEMYFDPALKEQKIHPLMFQPLIENAFKYVRGDYKIQLEMKLDGNQIRVEIKNSISQTQTQNTVRKKEAGMGIENLKRRLNLLYPGKHTLEIKQTENRFVVELIITAD
ncbi:MAG: histidine kinase [Tannerella sp.]|jgi:sensor histidine kinase YesM|nr:histidine kinase [Tannerella sp.]